MISPDDIKTEPDERNNDENIQSFSNASAQLKDNSDDLSIIQNVCNTQQSIDQTTAVIRPSIKEWLVNGLVHCPKCKKTKQIPYAFRRPTICQICKVNYVNQCAICKKKFTKFKTLRLHLQSKCNGKQLSMKKETEAYISEHSSTNLNDESFQQIKVEINGSEVGSNVDIVHTTVEPNVGKYSCSLCKKLFTNKYRKNSHEKNCKQLNCERCDFEATTSEHLRDHMRSAHTIIDPADYFLCNKCTKPFTDKFVKNKHEKYCGLELNLKCPKENCYYFTNRIERLQAHIQTTHISLLPQF